MGKVIAGNSVLNSRSRRAGLMVVCAFLAWPVRADEPSAPLPRAAVPEERTDALFERRRAEIRERRAAGRIDWLFLGDSITQRWDADIWEQSFGARNAANFGIDGDRTQHLLWRATSGGELDGLAPGVVILLIGVNNIGTDPPEAVAVGIEKIVDAIHARLPAAHIALFAIFPAGPNPGPFRERIEKTNALVADLARHPYVRYLDIGDRFLDADRRIRREIMPDYLHLSSAGYRIWAEALRELDDATRK